MMSIKRIASWYDPWTVFSSQNWEASRSASRRGCLQWLRSTMQSWLASTAKSGRLSLSGMIASCNWGLSCSRQKTKKSSLRGFCPIWIQDYQHRLQAAAGTERCHRLHAAHLWEGRSGSVIYEMKSVSLRELSIRRLRFVSKALYCIQSSAAQRSATAICHSVER